MRTWLTFGIILIVLTGAAAAKDVKLDLPNGDFEKSTDGKPAEWEPLLIGSPVEFASDTQEKHSGSSSARLTAPKTTRAYFRSKPIPVAAGEKISASAWVKFKDVPVGEGSGTIIMIAEFCRNEKFRGDVAKFDVVDRKKETSGDWQKIEGTLEIPPLATLLRLRLGFSYSHGTCWFDDVTLSAEKPIVVRAEIEGERLTPAAGSIPVGIVNRDGRKSDVQVRVSLDKQKASRDVKLDGSPLQRVEVPLEINKRGKAVLETSIEGAFSEKRDVVIPPAITLHPLIPTHWVTEDGPAKIDADIELAVKPDEMKNASLKLSVAGTDASTVAEKINADGTAHITLNAPNLKEGDYTVTAELTTASGKTEKAEQPWSIIPRRLAKVTINSDGYPVYDGKAIFPFGVYNGGKLEEQQQAGCTVSHAYNAVNYEPGERNRDEDAKRFLDASLKYGHKAMFLIPRGIVFSGDWETFRRRVRMFRNHPGLLMWDEEEGIARGDMKPDALKKMCDIIREEDPNHPIMIGDPHAGIAEMEKDRSNFFPNDLMDLGQWWWYPFPPEASSDDALAGEQKQKGELRLPDFFVKRNTDKPVWLGLQSYKKGKPARFPTPVEYRCQPYIAVCEGAKGIMWYGGYVTDGLYALGKDKKPNLDEGHWDYMQKLWRELADLSPVFLAPSGEKPKTFPENAPTSVCIKHADRPVLIAVNRSFKPAEITLKSPEIHAGSAQVRTENREVQCDEGELKDHFEPLEVHVYEWPAK